MRIHQMQRHGLNGLLSLSSRFIVGGLLCCAAWSMPRAAFAEEMLQVQVRHVGFDRQANSPVVILEDADQARFLPIWIGAFEARAIAMELDGVPPPRPLTHDLIKNILEQVGVQFQKIVVSALRENTYYARIHLASADGQVEVDSRPSDAIALALRFGRPIFVAPDIFEKGGVALPTSPRPISTKVGGVEVQNLTAELADYFRLPNADGVLVTDSAHRRGELQRGDIILALDGEQVRNVSDFRKRMQSEDRTVRLLVRRAGRDVGIKLTPQDGK